MEAEASAPQKYPDRLVAFVHLLEQADIDVQHFVDAATEINLADVPAVPELVEGEEIPDGYEDAKRVHDWAYALTGASARARSAVAQISDGETPGMIDTGPDQVADLVAEVGDRIARETAEAQAGEQVQAAPADVATGEPEVPTPDPDQPTSSDGTSPEPL